MESATAITVHVPPPLRNCCAGASTVAVSADSVRGALDELESRYPSLYRNVCNETGAVRPHVSIFVNTARVRHDALDTGIGPGDELTIMPAVSGG